MSILGFNSSSSHSNSDMMSQSSHPFFHGFKKQASFYIKEKIKTARLALTDVTPAQLLASFDKKNWRPSYNALILLEHLMTHGPESVAKEFQDEMSSIRQMQCFHHVDEKGFNWGLAVRKKSERILELLEKKPLLKQERNRAREVTRGIQGFGSFSKRTSSSKEGILQESKTTATHEIFGRSHSQFNEHSNLVNDDDDSNILPSTENNQTKGKGNAVVEKPPSVVVVIERVSSKENMAPVRSYEASREEFHGWSSSESGEMNSLLSGGRSNAVEEEDHHHHHPFGAIEKQSKISLLGGEEED